MKDLKHLGKRSAEPIDEVEVIDYELESIGESASITLETEEFTSLCPVTQQPDFGRIKITYSPAGKIIESKSLKLFLLGYRNKGMFYEDIVKDIGRRLAKTVEPLWITVEGTFKSRGGIVGSATFQSGR